jgi:CRISPR/Cas system endoribonuclease Cas6 (RAMP superfamily)
MKHDDLEELLSLIASKLDVTDIVDILDLEIEDFVELLRDNIEEKYDEFKEACE